MYKDVQAVDKEVRDANMDKLTEDIVGIFYRKIWGRRNSRKNV